MWQHRLLPGCAAPRRQPPQRPCCPGSSARPWPVAQPACGLLQQDPDRPDHQLHSTGRQLQMLHCRKSPRIGAHLPSWLKHLRGRIMSRGCACLGCPRNTAAAQHMVEQSGDCKAKQRPQLKHLVDVALQGVGVEAALALAVALPAAGLGPGRQHARGAGPLGGVPCALALRAAVVLAPCAACRRQVRVSDLSLQLTRVPARLAEMKEVCGAAQS